MNAGGATVGVAEHGNSAFLVTLSADGALLDRRQVTLTENLPTHPYHHEGAWAVGRYLDSPWARPISLAEAVALIERVHHAADQGADQALASLAAELPSPIAAIAIRRCPRLPPTIEERIADHRAQLIADGVMYRQALATAAERRRWRVEWYDSGRVFADAAIALDSGNINQTLTALGRTLGPPWTAKHKMAAAAAILAARRYSAITGKTT